MASKHAAESLLSSSRCLRHRSIPIATQARPFSALQPLREELQTQTPTEQSHPLPPASKSKKVLTPDTVVSRRQERTLWFTQSKFPIGSRRRRVALQHTTNIPFEQLPYQCFQEARKVLAADREEKVAQIEETRRRIAKLEAEDPVKNGGERAKMIRLESMKKHLEELKVLADINDPIVKKMFEDGLGDMNKPIYRFLADREWRTYKRKILMQRITQMGVIPDVLPQIDPVMEVRLAFGRKNVQPGDKVNSSWSEQAPTLTIQPFEKGEKLVTVVVVDSDVPDLEKDGFDYRCHGIFANIAIDPTKTKVSLAQLPEAQVPMEWVPPTAQKGSPYHRLSIWVLEQPEGKTVDVALAQKTFERDGFVLRRFLDKCRIAWGNKAAFKPVGITMFRTEWDENMEGVMQRAGIEGWDVEFKRKRVEPLPYRKKDGARYRGG